jgi:hypothetical protein
MMNREREGKDAREGHENPPLRGGAKRGRAKGRSPEGRSPGDPGAYEQRRVLGVLGGFI